MKPEIYSSRVQMISDLSKQIDEESELIDSVLNKETPSFKELFDILEKYFLYYPPLYEAYFNTIKDPDIEKHLGRNERLQCVYNRSKELLKKLYPIQFVQAVYAM